MREIEFRAWDKTHNRMIDWAGMQAWMIGSLENNNIMQFTGLLDKNGKKIFEGDIMKTGEGNMEVVYHNGQFTFRISDLVWAFGHCGLGNYEVIGNVHENPELLEGK